MRRTGLLENREDIRRVWDRVASLAIDFIQNSGRLKGAVDQVIADTVGTGLRLSARPDLSRLGYDAKETAEWSRMVEARFRRWAWNPAECDFRGKFTLPQLCDIGLRHQFAYGESLGVIDYMSPLARRAYGIESGVKLCMITPSRLVRDTSEVEGLFSGVIHDANSRPVAYRFREREAGIDRTRDYLARDRAGRQLVLHAFDPWDATDVRGISVIAAAMRTHAQAEQLGDATLATAILQTAFAATLTSPDPSEVAFKAIEDLDGWDEAAGIKEEFAAYFRSRLDKAREGGIAIDGSARVSHLAPGEKLDLLTTQTPGSNYLPFQANLDREMARCIGITAESYTLDQKGATYASTRMGNSSIWPVVLRRRERIAAPHYQISYENWLDEEIGEGRIPLKGGYAAFQANRNAVLWAEWQGPPKPTADDYKSALASTERMQNGTSTLEVECADLGLDADDVMRKRAEDVANHTALGLPNPYERVRGGGVSQNQEAVKAETIDA